MFRVSLNSLRFASLLGYCAYTGCKYPTQLEQKDEVQLYDTNAVREMDQKELTYKLKTRNDHINEIKRTSYDVVIIGGGATGAGIALECSQRGLRSLVIESEDFAAGASSKSTKLVHGGVRYLQQVFELSTEGGRLEKMKLVIEALKERSTFLTISQMHTQEIPILIPCSTIFHALFYYTGSMMYHAIYKLCADLNTFQFSIPRIITKDEINLHFKDLQCKYGVLYSDGQFNDARMVQELLLTSTLEKYHARQCSHSNIINYSHVQKFIKNESGRITGVEFQDNITKENFKVQAKAVVNATGCFADVIRKMDNPTTLNKIVPSGGSHIILPYKYGSDWGLLVPETSDGRILFVLPWLDRTLVGTTDKLFSEPVINPTVSKEELTWLIEQYSTQFVNHDPATVMAAVTSKWCGIRPLVLEQGYTPGDKIDTKKVARSHCIEVSSSGLISVMGGKWTIYRKMAEETVDRVFSELQAHGAGKPALPSISKKMKLLGDLERRGNDAHEDRISFITKYAKILSQKYNISINDARYFVQTYGDRAFDILKLTSSDAKYQRRIHPQFPHTVGEILYLIRYEMAMTPQDIFFRRTRLGFLDIEVIYKIYVDVMEVFAEEFKWTDKVRKQQLHQNLDIIRALRF